MPRSVKETDEDAASQKLGTRRVTRAASNPAAIPAVTDSPRRSTRRRQTVIQDGSSPESIVSEPRARTLRPRNTSVTSDISEIGEFENKRVTRRSSTAAAAASVYDTPTKNILRRAVRAGSETKTMSPAVRTRTTRAGSVDDDRNVIKSLELPGTPVRGARTRRASAIPSEPPVTEEPRVVTRRGRSKITNIDNEDNESEKSNTSGNTSGNLSTSIESDKNTPVNSPKSTTKSQHKLSDVAETVDDADITERSIEQIVQDSGTKSLPAAIILNHKEKIQNQEDKMNDLKLKKLKQDLIDKYNKTSDNMNDFPKVIIDKTTVEQHQNIETSPGDKENKNLREKRSSISKIKQKRFSTERRSVESTILQQVIVDNAKVLNNSSVDGNIEVIDIFDSPKKPKSVSPVKSICPESFSKFSLMSATIGTFETSIKFIDEDNNEDIDTPVDESKDVVEIVHVEKTNKSIDNKIVQENEIDEKEESIEYEKLTEYWQKEADKSEIIQINETDEKVEDEKNKVDQVSIASEGSTIILDTSEVSKHIENTDSQDTLILSSTTGDSDVGIDESQIASSKAERNETINTEEINSTDKKIDNVSVVIGIEADNDDNAAIDESEEIKLQLSPEKLDKTMERRLSMKKNNGNESDGNINDLFQDITPAECKNNGGVMEDKEAADSENKTYTNIPDDYDYDSDDTVIIPTGKSPRKSVSKVTLEYPEKIDSFGATRKSLSQQNLEPEEPMEVDEYEEAVVSVKTPGKTPKKSPGKSLRKSMNVSGESNSLKSSEPEEKDEADVPGKVSSKTPKKTPRKSLNSSVKSTPVKSTDVGDDEEIEDGEITEKTPSQTPVKTPRKSLNGSMKSTPLKSSEPEEKNEDDEEKTSPRKSLNGSVKLNSTKSLENSVDEEKENEKEENDLKEKEDKKEEVFLSEKNTGKTPKKSSRKSLNKNDKTILLKSSESDDQENDNEVAVEEKTIWLKSSTSDDQDEEDDDEKNGVPEKTPSKTPKKSPMKSQRKSLNISVKSSEPEEKEEEEGEIVDAEEAPSKTPKKTPRKSLDSSVKSTPSKLAEKENDSSEKTPDTASRKSLKKSSIDSVRNTPVKLSEPEEKESDVTEKTPGKASRKSLKKSTEPEEKKENDEVVAAKTPGKTSRKSLKKSTEPEEKKEEENTEVVPEETPSKSSRKSLKESLNASIKSSPLKSSEPEEEEKKNDDETEEKSPTKAPRKSLNKSVKSTPQKSPEKKEKKADKKEEKEANDNNNVEEIERSFSSDESEDLDLSTFNKSKKLSLSRIVNLDSNSEVDSPNSDSDVEVVPAFMFGNSYEDSDDDDDDDDEEEEEEEEDSDSIDSDYRKDLNLDGDMSLKYSDDDVPADDCLQSDDDSLASDDEDDSDMDDFVVDDDEDVDEEEEDEDDNDDDEDESEEDGVTIEEIKDGESELNESSKNSSKMEEAASIDEIKSVDAADGDDDEEKSPEKVPELNNSQKKKLKNRRSMAFENLPPKSPSDDVTSPEVDTPRLDKFKKCKSTFLPTVERDTAGIDTPRPAFDIKIKKNLDLSKTKLDSTPKTRLVSVDSSSGADTPRPLSSKKSKNSPRSSVSEIESSDNETPKMKVKKSLDTSKDITPKSTPKSKEVTPKSNDFITPKSNGSFKEPKTAKSLLQTSIMTSIEKANLLKPQKSHGLNHSLLEKPSESPDLILLMKEKLNDTLPTMKLDTKSKSSKRNSMKNASIIEDTEDENVPEEKLAEPVNKSLKNKNKLQEVVESLAEENLTPKDKKKKNKKTKSNDDSPVLVEKADGECKKSNKRSHVSEEEEEVASVEVKNNKKQRVVVANEEDGDAPPPSISFEKARDQVMEAMKKQTESTNANKKSKKSKKNKSKVDSSVPLPVSIDAKYSSKRLSDEMVDSLSDAVNNQPAKKRKIEAKIMPTRCMYPGEVPSYMKIDDYVPFSSSTSGGTTQFTVINLKKKQDEKKTKNNTGLLGYRERMLARNKRQPISAFLMHQKKLNAAGNNKK